MTTIRANCPHCGEVSLTPVMINLQTCLTQMDLSSYHFECPDCQQMIDKPATEHIVAMLMSGGVTSHQWTIPKEWFEPKRGPRIGYDDLLDLAMGMEKESYLSFLAS